MGKYSYLDPSAKKGFAFTYMGEAYECEECAARERCHGSLTVGFSYRILRKTGGEKVYCLLRGGEAAPFEIDMEPLILLAPGRVKEGAVTIIENSFCRAGCSRILECPVVFNMLVSNRRLRVLEKLGAFDCPEKRLILVKAEIVEEE
ncbi:MAG: UPF0179 family protein [Crenarchaeota archaeon]|nr:UPF0179 family protein [Thermoproteota archaeon]